MFGLLALLMEVIIVGWVLKEQVSGPLQGLLVAIRALARGDAGVKTQVERNDEVGQLAKAFDEMADAVALHRSKLEDQVRERTRALEDAIHALVGRADVLFGGSGEDQLLGGGGNDTMIGGWAGDFLAGGKGNDRLEGGYGNDTYQFNRGDGTDTVKDMYIHKYQQVEWYMEQKSVRAGNGDGNTYVNEWNQRFHDAEIELNAGEDDKIAFGPGISINDVMLQRVGNDLILALKDPQNPNASFDSLKDRITVEDWSNGMHKVESLAFADGTKLNIQMQQWKNAA
mgnify:CR=1 FL=1